MTADVISEHDIAHLADQFANARPLLFTGAGFSLDAKNSKEEDCPTFEDVRKALWEMCFAGQPLDADSTVQDLYDIALGQHKKILEDSSVRLKVE